MVREIYYFFRYGPTVKKRQKELGLVEFLKTISKELDADGFAELRSSLVGDLVGDVLDQLPSVGPGFHPYDQMVMKSLVLRIRPRGGRDGNG